MRIARARKTIAAAVGMAVTLVLLVPEESIPERFRPYAGLVLALGTVFGVYRVANAPSPRVAPTLFAGRPGQPLSSRVRPPAEESPPQE